MRLHSKMNKTELHLNVQGKQVLECHILQILLYTNQQ